ncbi:MAG: Crp/Fnr family transcriptional regulator [Gemmatimonadota bacterium]
MPEAISHTLVKALRSVPDFAALDDRTLLRIVGASANLVWPAGATVFERGSTSEALYVVLSGAVSVSEPSGDDETEIAVVRPGSSFGELSLMLRTTHTKTARTTEATELMVLPRESFEELLASSPELAHVFRHRLEERLPLRGAVTDTT